VFPVVVSDGGQGGTLSKLNDIRDVYWALRRIFVCWGWFILFGLAFLTPPSTFLAIVELGFILRQNRSGLGRFSGFPASSPLDDIDESRLHDLDIASGQVSKGGQLEVTTISS
jgi:hypothetical protein